MIKKISKIKDFAVFNDFDWDKSVLNRDGRPFYFEKLNIIYGRNYSGKTTLSRILRSLETGKLPDNCGNPAFTVSFCDDPDITQGDLSGCTKSVRVFNKDFIKDNLQFIYNQDKTIEPFAILGDNNATIEAEISKIEIALGSNEDGKETALYAQLKNEKKILADANAAFSKANNDLDSLLADKATKQGSGIKYNSDKFGDQNYTKPKLLNDIEVVLAPTYTPISNDQKTDCEKLLNEQTKPTIPDLSPLHLSFDQHCSTAEELLSRKIGASDKIAELLLDTALNDWVKTGCALHEHKRDACAFCGNKISNERWSVLHAHFDEESKKLEEDIDQAIKAIEAEKQIVYDSFSVDKNLFYAKYHQQIDELKQAYTLAAAAYNEQLDLLVKQLSSRKEKITTLTSLAHPENKAKAITEISTKYIELKNESDKFSEQLTTEQTNAKKTLRLREVYDFCSTINYSKLCTDKDGLKTKAEGAQETVNKTQAVILEKQAEIEDKKRLLNDEEKGAVRVNDFLNNFFGHNFLSLKAIQSNDDDSKKTHFEIVREGKRAYNLSEGECSLIAFCYFIAKLDSIDTKGKKPIIWVDDPISSLDGNHIFFVYSLLVAEIAEKGNFEQLFVSTHNLDFLKYLRRLKCFETQDDGKLKECNKQYFLIARQGKVSTLEKLPKYLKEYGTEFNYLFSCINKCASVSAVDDTNYELFYNFGNNARKFLEIYLYFKYPDFSKQDEKLQKFWGSETIPPILTDRINNEYSHLAGSVERASMPIEVPEMLTTAKQIIKKIKEDKEQYSALMRSIGEKEDEPETA